MENQEYISHIINKVQLSVINQRTLKRSSLLNSCRSNFEETERKLKLPSLLEFKQLCLNFVKRKKLEDLQRIRFGLSVGEQYISAFLSTDRGLYSLVGSLTGGNAKLQLESLHCFINLGLGSYEQCLRICEKAGAYLVSLGSDNPQLLDLCLWVFGNLCGSHSKVCIMARKQGLEYLIMKSIGSNDESVFHSAAYVLNQYLSTSPFRIKDLITCDTIKHLINCLKTNKDATKDICWCLFMISSQKSNCTHLFNFGMVFSSLQLLSDTVKDMNFDVCIVTALVRLLTNIVAVLSNVAIEICYQADIFVPVCNQLLICQYPHLHQETTQLIANVINGAEYFPSMGSHVLEDSCLRERLEPALKHHFASNFKLNEPVMQFT